MNMDLNEAQKVLDELADCGLLVDSVDDRTRLLIAGHLGKGKKIMIAVKMKIYRIIASSTFSQFMGKSRSRMPAAS
jgi:hypothetical protein